MSPTLIAAFLPLPPLLAFILISIFTYQKRGLSHWLAVGAAGLSWIGSMVIFGVAISQKDLASNPIAGSINWIPIGTSWLQAGVFIDPLSTVTVFFVAWTVLCIFVYSIGYHYYGQPEGDHDVPGLPPHGKTIIDAGGHLHKVPSIEPLYSRFFAFISLFAFGMFALVVTDNLLILYMAWEVMGLCSYLLIGFWFGRPASRDAAVKAFLTTRVGDMFMLLGLAVLYSLTGSLNFRAILASPDVLHGLAGSMSPILGLSWASLVGILLFLGTIGKSAQFPLHIWLPEAMEGPTPVSAMIHAATMVSAGIYLVARFFPLITAGSQGGLVIPSSMLVMIIVGTFTMIFAASIALVQSDIKRVLAYSTISQLGVMITALGAGAFGAAVFHLVTHAFFKALLFLSSGSVINSMENGILKSDDHHVDPLNMFEMGGLRLKMPVTFWSFVIGGLSLAGFPLVTAGFWSKDAILAGLYHDDYLPVFIIIGLSAFLTAFYTGRLLTLTFFGKPRSAAAANAKEPNWYIKAPLVALAVFAVAAGWVGIPAEFPLLGGLLPDWISGFLNSMVSSEGLTETHSLVPLITSVTVTMFGLALGWWIYRKQEAKMPDPLRNRLGLIFTMLQNKYFIDEVYSWLLIRPTRWISDTLVSSWIDRQFLDGIINGVANLSMALGSALRKWFDLPVINGMGDQVGRQTSGIGNLLRHTQGGRIQQYMLIGIGSLLIIAVIFFSLLGIVR